MPGASWLVYPLKDWHLPEPRQFSTPFCLQPVCWTWACLPVHRNLPEASGAGPGVCGAWHAGALWTLHCLGAEEAQGKGRQRRAGWKCEGLLGPPC